MAQYSPFTATGDGTTTAYTFAFDYIDTADVKARVNNVVVTNFTVSGSTLTFTTPPPNGQSVKIFRDTDNQTIQADFQSGSALRAVDLNDNFTQLLFVTQESTDVADTATTDAANSVVASNNAVATANTALANSRESDGQGGFTSAISLSNTALNNSRESDGQGGFNSAISIANSALTNSRESDGQGGFNSAISVANNASTIANAAQTAVAAAVLYAPIANVSSIPGSPSNEDYIEVQDSTGIESFSPLSGLPSGFIGTSGLSARLQYLTSNNSWNWQSYFANDPESRYVPATGATFTGAVNFEDNVVIKGDSTNGSGKITLNCEVNTHGVHIKGPPHSAGATYTLTLPNNTGTNGQALLTDGSGVMSWGDVTTDLSGVLALTGGTMIGAITLSGAPTASLHAASKQYVDDNKIIAIDAGNFDNGSSTISSTLTIDGGSF